jgi:hypothetical protein
MESIKPTITTVAPASTSLLISKNSIIIVLVVLLILSFLGINVLMIGSNIISSISNIVVPVFINILSFFGFTTGTILVNTSTVVGQTAKQVIDVAEDALTKTGDTLINISKSGQLSTSIQKGESNVFDPEPVSASNPIVTKSKTGWCLVGEYQDQRGCVEVTETDKCMSGQIFPSKQACLTPQIA